MSTSNTTKPKLHHDTRCRKCSGTGRQGVDIGGIVVHPLGWTECDCAAPTTGTRADSPIERVWVCPCGARISLRRRGRNARAAVSTLGKLIRDHLATHRGSPRWVEARSAREDLPPYIRQGLIADAMMRDTDWRAAAPEGLNHDIHVVHDSLIIDFVPATTPKQP